MVRLSLKTDMFSRTVPLVRSRIGAASFSLMNTLTGCVMFEMEGQKPR